MTDIRNLINLVEAKNKQDLSLAPLPYKRTELAPAMSADTLDYHYGKLARGYVDRYNSNEGDSDFNEAGAFLHNIFFPQLMPPRSGNKPVGNVAALIDRKYGSFDKFKTELTGEAMAIQGSGWIYMSRSGDIKTIRNHAIRRDIVLLIDWWEHAWALDYQAAKDKYLKNIWRIIDWQKVEARL